ncbi:MAG: hypothetical protein GKS06_03445 [Acidobacteria bacterium]|nr:hypothetical protein [Acidobacteriota bacterium]
MKSMHRAFHRALMGGLLLAVLATGVGVMQPWAGTASAQHGGDHQTTPAEHYTAIAGYLELNEEQEDFLRGPVMNALQKMEELGQLHAVIAAELSEDQKTKFAGIVKGTLEASLGGGAGHDGEAHHDGGHHGEGRD